VGEELMHVGLGDDPLGQGVLDGRQLDGLADVEMQVPTVDIAAKAKGYTVLIECRK
jgi:hypothetical protein